MQQRSQLATIGIIAAVVIGAVAVFAFLGRGPDNGALTGKTWHLTAITGQTPSFQGVFPPEEQALYTIAFATDGTVAARADCNAVAGTYALSGDDGITITLGASTVVACPDGSYGSIFAHELTNVTTWGVASAELTLTTADGGAGTFVEGSGSAVVPSPSAAPSASASASASASPSPTASPTASPTPTATASPTPTATASPTPTATASPTPAASASAAPTVAPSAAPTPAPSATPAPTPTPTPAPTPTPTPAPSPGGDLIGTSWQLTSITTRDPVHEGAIPAEERSKYTIAFATGGQFSAVADCNTIAGTWTATATGGLDLAILPSTIVACGDGSHGDLYVLALSNTASYVIATNTLTITLADEGTLAYEPAP